MLTLQFVTAGLCNNFEFPDEFVKALYKANVKAGVDYMEFGYKASKELFNEKDFGKWKFCNDDDIREVVGENNTDLKIAVMADVGRTDFKNDILPKNESPIDLVRIATYINTIPAAVEMIEDCAKKGYETTINIMANSTLNNARMTKKDEFYTMFYDIETEMEAYLDYNPNVFRGKTVLLPCDDPEWSNFTKYFAQNFKDLGLKKLISTSYAINSKVIKAGIQTSFLETASPKFDKSKTNTHGKIFVLEKKTSGDGKINLEDLEWDYLEGDGDFRSEEVKKLRDEADIIVTNPPFSLFREFLAWIVEADKQFIIIGNINCVTYKEVFPLLKDNKVWMGCTIHSGDREFGVPDEYPLEAAGCRIDENGKKYIRVKGVRWYTNIDHGSRHDPLSLMSMADNIKYSKHKEIQGKTYQHYDNYDAIEIQHSFPAKHNILDSCVIQVIENNRANADLLRDFLFIFQIGILFLNNTLCFRARLI